MLLLLLLLLLLPLLLRAGCALLLGPLRGGEVVADQPPKGGAHRDVRASSEGQDGPSLDPAATSRSFRPWMAENHLAGVSFRECRGIFGQAKIPLLAAGR